MDPRWSPPAGHPTWEQRHLLLGGDLSRGSCLGQQLALPVKPGMQLPRLLKIMGISGLSGHHVQLASCQRKIFTQLKYLGSPTSLQQSDPTCFPQSCNHLSSIVQFLTIGGSRRYSELGNGRETSWASPLSVCQQSAAWTQAWTHVVYAEGGRGEVQSTHIHITFKAHRKTNGGKVERNKRKSKAAGRGRK